MPMSHKIISLSAAQAVDARTRRMSQLAFAVGGFAIGTAEFVIMGLLPEVAHAMHVDIPTAGHFISFYAAGVVVGAPVMAVLTARVPRKILLISFMLFYALSNVASAFASSYDVFTLLRFLSGLPHGIYFGVAAIAAASMVPSAQRPQAIGNVMLGLTVATVIGAPGGTWLGQLLGWRAAFIMVGGIALVAAMMIWRYVPHIPTAVGASPLAELGALKSGQLWLLLAVIAIGSGGLFSVFSYIKPILVHVSGAPLSMIPFILPLFGCGMVAGNLIGPYIAFKLGLMRSIFVTMLWSILTFLIFYFLAPTVFGAAVATFLIGTSFMSQPAIQTRIMDVSANAPTLAASLMQSAFNIANAIGAYAGGLVIAAGLGWTSTAWLGAVLALCGFLIFVLSWIIEVRATKNS